MTACNGIEPYLWTPLLIIYCSVGPFTEHHKHTKIKCQDRLKIVARTHYTGGGRRGGLEGGDVGVEREALGQQLLGALQVDGLILAAEGSKGLTLL